MTEKLDENREHELALFKKVVDYKRQVNNSLNMFQHIKETLLDKRNTSFMFKSILYYSSPAVDIDNLFLDVEFPCEKRMNLFDREYRDKKYVDIEDDLLNGMNKEIVDATIEILERKLKDINEYLSKWNYKG